MNLHFPRLHSAWRLWNPSSPKLPRNLYLDIHRFYHIYLTFREISIFSAPFPCDNWKSKNPGENCESIFSLLVQKINPSKLLRRKNQKKINPPTCFLRILGGFLSETCGFPCSNASTPKVLWKLPFITQPQAVQRLDMVILQPCFPSTEKNMAGTFFSLNRFPCKKISWWTLWQNAIKITTNHKKNIGFRHKTRLQTTSTHGVQQKTTWRQKTWQ